MRLTLDDELMTNEQSEILVGIIMPLAAAFMGHYIFLVLYKLCRFPLDKDDRVGRCIGYWERALVAIFVLAGRLEATVFIFGAKAALLTFRIPDRKALDRKQTVEYMLIGSMISYTIAIVFGYCGRLLLKVGP